ncbi:MAG: hypothetical protein A2X46_08070 [Lentisphaerae bacterium GWF2_57_35]|nr:MAG: hypothetical protein A2X46_08070 [Lentisphaerae bacterium GWF2_57_35]
MISVQEAERIVAQHSPSSPPVPCPLAKAQGRILREEIHADRDQPPFHRVMMDGIAISPHARESGQTSFLIESTHAAGAPPLRLNDPTACIQVMTGATLPEGCDGVIPYEDLSIRGQQAELNPGLVLKPMQWVHVQGADRKKNERLLAPGMRLLSPQIAILASTGRTEVRVGAIPSIAIVSTGNELVDIGQELEPYQIRPSNAYGFHAALNRAGFDRVDLSHARDDRSAIRQCVEQALSAHDVLILSGGVSMGKLDFVPEVLEQLSVVPLFHKIRQRPGKPFWFGVAPGGKQVFALPGNPLSSLICFHRYVLPSLFQSMGEPMRRHEQVLLGEGIGATGTSTLFIPVTLKQGIEAIPISHHGSGDLSALAESTGFVELPEGPLHFEKGTAVGYHRWN